MSTTSGSGVDPELSVNEILRRWPATAAPLGAFGIDTCCGGALPLREASCEAGVPLAELVAAIDHAITAGGGRETAPGGTR